MPPVDVKIDGKALEWNNHFQAYNRATDIFYTMANDDDKTIRALKISGREMQVLKLIVAGLTNVMIAQELNLSKLTVKKHRENLMRKLQASNTAQLIANAGLKRIL